MIPDIGEAVSSPIRVTDDPMRASEVVRLASHIPPKVWGRDPGRTGEMWNSNSVIAWVLARGGLDVQSIHPPPGGRAPGWAAGLEVARRQTATASG